VKPPKWVIGMVTVWGVLTLAGVSLMARYDSTAGPDQSAPSQWPERTSLKLAGDPFQAFLFVHPYCACTRATLSELERLMQTRGRRLRVTISIVTRKDQDYKSLAIYETVRAIPDVAIVADPEGAEARRFGAVTSGFLALYNQKGDLLFSGGITGARGEEGDNRGRSAVEEIVDGKAGLRRALVFGCGLGTAE
jgi:hypothetical protein